MNFAKYQEIMRLQYGGAAGVAMLPDNIHSVLNPGMKLISGGGDSLKQLNTWFPGQPQISLKSQRAVPHLDNKAASSPSQSYNQPMYLPNPKYQQQSPV